MSKKIIALITSVLLSAPCILHAGETKINLFKVEKLESIQQEMPLGDPTLRTSNSVQSSDFTAVIDSDTLTITKQNATILEAKALVVNVSTGNMIVNQGFSTTFSSLIQVSGSFWLTIQTNSGTLVGLFEKK